MTHHSKTLKNEKLGITEFDIKDCNDIDQLLEWKMEIIKDIAEMTHDINLAKVKREMGEYSDPVWYFNALHAKKCQGMLDQMIATRLRVLRVVKEETNKDQNEDLMRRFAEVAAEELPEKTFLTILKKAQAKNKK